MSRREERRKTIGSLAVKFGYELQGNEIKMDKDLDIVERISRYSSGGEDYVKFVRAVRTHTLDQLRDQRRNAESRLKTLRKKKANDKNNDYNIDADIKTVENQIEIIKKDVDNLKKIDRVKNKSDADKVGKEIDKLYRRSVHTPTKVGTASVTRTDRNNYERNATVALKRGFTSNGYEINEDNAETLRKILEIAGEDFKDLVDSASDYSDMYEGMESVYINGIEKLEQNIPSIVKDEEALSRIRQDSDILEFLYVNFGSWENLK